MPTLPPDRIRTLLAPFLPADQATDTLIRQLGTYLDLLMRWNGRTNLTAVRDPEEIVTRHFGESLFVGATISARLPASASLLDFGSGAGFPGLPIQLLLPDLQVTLAESQGKKAAFLRECVRVLALPTELWPKRVEDMHADRLFDTVALRAVDNMESAMIEAGKRLKPEGFLAILGGQALAAEFPDAEIAQLPASSHRYLIISSATLA